MDVPADGSGRTDTRGQRLRELAGLFLRLGTTAFGGPAAHVALMQQEVVDRRKWVTATEFLDMYAAANFIPGPNSTEMTIFIGYRRAGWAGLLVAGISFILPAAVMCTILAALYLHFEGAGAGGYGHKVADAILWGVKPVVIGVVLHALWRLARSVVKTLMLGGLATAAVGALICGGNELVVLFGAGVVVLLLREAAHRRTPGGRMTLSALAVPATAVKPATTLAGLTATTAAVVTQAPLLLLFLTFLKIGAVLFGSGYVLLAFLQTDFVEHYHWLTQERLLDAVAVGQVTPGPVFTTATFIGYIATGSVVGAAVASAGIFLPAFAFVALSAPLLPWMRRSKRFGAFLDGLNAASLALMAVVTAQLTVEAIAPAGIDRIHRLDAVALGLAVASLAVLLWKDVNSAWLVVGGAALGLAWRWVA